MSSRNLKNINLKITCTNCNTYLHNRKLVIAYEFPLDVSKISKDLRPYIPRGFFCRKCKSGRHNEISYTFFHKQIIS